MNIIKTKRQKLSDLVKLNNEKIAALHSKNRDILIKSYLLCDDKKTYVEKEEERGKGKNKITQLTGRIKWIQVFEDADTGEKVPIERSEVVRINGEWQC